MKFLKGSFIALLLLFTIQLSTQAVAFTSYKLDPNQCHKIITKTGSVIFLPEKCFDIKSGIIEIQYREFHSYNEIIQEKIEMFHKMGPGRRLLESGGMFEIKAFHDGNPIELKAGQTIEVTFAARKELQNLQVFYYDYQNKNWQLTTKTFKTAPWSKQNNKTDGPTSGKPNIFSTNNDGDGDFQEDSISRKKREEAQRLQTAVFRTMNIDKMGLYNYDRIMNEQNVLIANIEFKLKGETANYAGQIFCVHSKFNTVTYHYSGQKSEFAYAPDGELSFFAILNKDTVVKISKQQLTDFKNQIKKESTMLILDEYYRFENNDLKSVLGF